MRPKLDPRLAYLAGLPLGALRALKAAEDQALRAAVKRLSEPPQADRGDHRGADTEAERGAEEIRAREARLFAPLTAGVHLPKPGRGRGRSRDIRNRFDEPVFSVFILGDAGATDLRRFGAMVRSRSCDVSTAFLPRSALRAVEQSLAVRFIELARPWFYDLGNAVPYTQIATLHNAMPRIDGTGVAVGVVDNVLDIYHPDFRDAAGQTRLLYLWDQTLTPTGGEAGPPALPPDFLPTAGPMGPGTTYGVEYDQARINAELVAAGPPSYQIVRHKLPEPPTPPITDVVMARLGHGTFVTGCAAANGLGAGSPGPGAAPGSAIIFVSPLGYVDDTNLAADNTAVLDAVSYIFARAKGAGLPCVVNLSMGDNQGPHDGTTAGEIFLDGLLAEPGRAITLSAGNSTGTKAHASGNVAAGATETLVLTYGAGAGVSDDVEIWYDGHDRFTVAVTAPTAAAFGPVAPGDPPASGAVGGVTVTVRSTVNDPRNGDNLISIIIVVPPSQTIPQGDWSIALTGTVVINGRFDAWVDRNNRPKSAWKAPHLNDMGLTLGVPATARRPITVGNHQKVVPPVGPPPPPLIEAHSGLGPTRDGRTKPEVATVGTGLTAPRARNMDFPTAPAMQPLYQSQYVTGTSMSAPLVAGACALLFQCRGAAATCADLKQILTQAAGTTGLATVIPNGAFGFGFLQMGTACAAPAPDVDVWLRDDPADTGLEPSTAPVFWACPDMAILDTVGVPVPNPTHAPGARFNNIVEVTVRNRGSQTARNVSVFLYWADPATSIPFPAEWRSTGIYTGDGGGGFPDQGNHILVAQLGAGDAKAVRFAWAPPPPGSSLAGGGHFCLLARLEHELDPSNIAAGGFASITASNNIGLRNVLVQP